MDNHTYYLTLTATDISGVQYLDEQVFLGATNITFNLSGIDDSKNATLKTSINFGDGSNTISSETEIIRTYSDTDETVRIAQYGTFSEALNPYTHTYVPDITTYYLQLSAQLLLTFSNYAQYRIVIPIRITQDSYFTVYENLKIVSTQFVDTSANNVFAAIQSKTGNLYNVVLKTWRYKY